MDFLGFNDFQRKPGQDKVMLNFFQQGKILTRVRVVDFAKWTVKLTALNMFGSLVKRMNAINYAGFVPQKSLTSNIC